MTNRAAMEELLAKVIKGERPSHEEWSVAFPDRKEDDDYTRSMMAVGACDGWVDAALALLDALLPEWRVSEIEQHDDRKSWFVELEKISECCLVRSAISPILARAWLIATLRAKLAEGE